MMFQYLIPHWANQFLSVHAQHTTSTVLMNDISNDQSIPVLQQRYHQEYNALINEHLTLKKSFTAPPVWGTGKFEENHASHNASYHGTKNEYLQKTAAAGSNPNVKAADYITSFRLVRPHVAFVDAAICAQLALQSCKELGFEPAAAVSHHQSAAFGGLVYWWFYLIV